MPGPRCPPASNVPARFLATEWNKLSGGESRRSHTAHTSCVPPRLERASRAGGSTKRHKGHNSQASGGLGEPHSAFERLLWSENQPKSLAKFTNQQSLIAQAFSPT